MTSWSFLYSIYFVNVCDDCVFSPNKPPALTLLYGLWSKSSRTAIIDGTPLSIIQPYIWLANRMMIGLCTESSHINPILGPELLLSLPSCISTFLSLSLSSFLLLPIFIGLPSFFFLHIGLGLIFVSLQCFLSYLANHSTLQISHWLNFFPSIFCKSSVTGCHFIPTMLHLHQQVSNVTIARRQGRTIENHGGDTVCICVMGESEETEVREIWVSGYSDGTESLFEDSRDWYPRCFCSQPPWAQQKPKK